MPIEVYTGKPGNGKTAFMMERLMKEAEKGERNIVACGIDGLEPGLATVLDDPRTWNDKDDNGQYLIPNGSLIFVDEAWKWFGHLHDASRQATPKHVLALAEHRHRGIDFVWTTQGPNQLYPFARPLIADHWHCVRQFGTHMIDVYKWQELQEDVKSPAKRENAQRSTKALPKASFGKYKSAEVHTIKRRIPLRVLAIPALLVCAVVLGWLAFSSLKPDAFAAHLSGKEPESAQADPAQADQPPPSRSASRIGYVSASDYVAAHQARIGSLPWSAPVFDGRNAQSQPELFCMSAGIGQDVDGRTRGESVTCLTEQGTVYKVDEKLARYIARHGLYNPYKAVPAVAQQQPQQTQQQAPQVAPAQGAVIPAEEAEKGT